MAQSETDAISVSRIAGNSRYDTSLAISRAGFAASRYAVIASGANYPDALAGGQLAGYLAAPLLITRPDSVSDALLKELDRLGVEQIYLLGGEVALSKQVEEVLSRSYPVTRLHGENRLETSEAIAEEIIRLQGDTDHIFYADSHDFPDALTAAPLIVEKEGLLYLHHKSQAVTGGTAIGGPLAVPGDPTLRIYGDNRYETAVAVAKSYATPSDTVIIASGMNYPDALSGSGYATKMGYPILLTRPDALSLATGVYLQEAGIKHVIILGGPEAVGHRVVTAITRLQDNPPEEPEETEPVPVPDPETEDPVLPVIPEPEDPTPPVTPEPEDPVLPVTPEPGPSEKAYLYANGRVIANIESGIYHVKGQRFYEIVNYENARFFNTEAEARAAGFRRSKI